MREYDKVEILTKEREHLVLENIRFVEFVLKNKIHISMNDEYYDDYLQEGRLGLVKAAIYFDESRGVKFITFAERYIEGCVRRYRRDFVLSRLKIPRRIIDLIPKVMKLYYEGLTYNEICIKLNLSSEEVQDVLDVSFNVSLEQKMRGIGTGDDDLTIQDVIGRPDDNIVDVMGEEYVIDAIEKVALQYKNDEKRNMWYEYIYPALFGEKVPVKDIANKYGYSRNYTYIVLREGKDSLYRIFSKNDNY